MQRWTASIPLFPLSRRLLAGLLTAWLLFLGSAALAETRFVAASGTNGENTCLSSGAPCKTITHALTQAVAGDTISVAAGSYNLALGETFPLTITTDLTLTGAGAGSTILDATGANTRVIEVAGGLVTISDVTVTGGAVGCSGPCLGGPGDIGDAGGGGLRNSFGTLTLTNTTVSGNTVSCAASTGSCNARAGGVYNRSFGTLTLTNTTVSGNTVSCLAPGVLLTCDARGGGLFNFGTMTLTNSTVSGNTASCLAPGALFTCDASGGGIENFSTMTLTNTTVSGNMASCPAGNDPCAEGGGLSNGGTLTLTNTTVSGNMASCNLTGFSCFARGGGLFNFLTLTLTNSTVSGNTASCIGGFGCVVEGGGIENFGTLTLTNSTVSGNSANCTVGGFDCIVEGGGLYNVATVTLKNTIIAKQLTGSDCSTFSGTLTSNGFNLDSDGTCQLTQPSDHPGVSNPLLGPLQNNGGPTQTHALLPGSPAIDAGTNTGCPSTDQRGITRPQGGTCDIGAFEFGIIVAAVELTGTAFHTDQQITYQATLNPAFTPMLVDIYLGVLLPDGVTFLSFVPGPGGTIAFAFDTVPVPFAANVTLSPTVVPFAYMFNGAEPIGTYFTYAAAVIAESDPLQAENRLSLGVQAFQFTP